MTRKTKESSCKQFHHLTLLFHAAGRVGVAHLDPKSLGIVVADNQWSTTSGPRCDVAERVVLELPVLGVAPNGFLD